MHPETINEAISATAISINVFFMPISSVSFL